jgi:hypothetical protein
MDEGDSIQIWLVAVNILNKQSCTAIKGWRVVFQLVKILAWPEMLHRIYGWVGNVA